MALFSKPIQSFNLIKKYCHEIPNYTATEITPQNTGRGYPKINSQF